MDTQKAGHGQQADRSKNRIFVIGIVLALVAGIFLIFSLHKPVRSVAAYCKIYSQEKARLALMSNNSNPYPSGVFDATVTDAGEIAKSFSRLDLVTPKPIEPEVHNLQKLYQDIHNDPSHAISDAMNGGDLDDSLKAWTQQQCK